MNDQRLDELMDRIRSGLLSIASMPIGMETTDMFETSVADVRELAPAAVAALKTPMMLKSVHDGQDRLIQLVGEPDGRIEIDIRFKDAEFGVHLKDPELEARIRMDEWNRHAVVAVQMPSDLIADLAEASTLVRGLSLKLLHQIGGALAKAITDALAEMMQALLHDEVRAPMDAALRRINHAADLASAMIEAVRPGTLRDIRVDQAGRRVMARFAEPPAAEVEIPMADKVRALLPARPIALAYALRDGDDDASKDTLYVDFAPFPKGRKPRKVEPAEHARLVREHGGDGTSIARAMDAALARSPGGARRATP